MTGASDPAQLGPSARAACVIDSALPKVWDVFVPVYLPDLFPKAKGPIPPVVDVRDQTGRWDEIGQTRTVVLGDGNTAREKITYPKLAFVVPREMSKYMLISDNNFGHV